MGNIYLLYGEEDYLKKQKKEKLISSFIPLDDSMNLSFFEGKDVDINQVIDLSETMPFFAEYRVIVMENTGLFKEKGDELCEYLKNCPDTTVFVFSESEIDKRCKIYKFVSQKGTAEEVKTPEAETLVKWIGQKASKNGFKMRETTGRYMIERCGTDMYTLNNEMEKLFSYCSGVEVIEQAHIDDICTGQVQNEIFKMLEDITGGRSTMALKRYYDLIALREPPMRILALITRQFRIMYTVMTMSMEHATNAQIAQSTGIPPFSVKKYMGGKGFDINRVREALEECAILDQAIKTGNLNEQMSVELLIIKYSK